MKHDPDTTEVRRLKPGQRFEAHDPVTGELMARGEVVYHSVGRTLVKLETKREINFETRDGNRVYFVRPADDVSWAPETLVTPLSETRKQTRLG